jgi:hypothetical protein
MAVIIRAATGHGSGVGNSVAAIIGPLQLPQAKAQMGVFNRISLIILG